MKCDKCNKTYQDEDIALSVGIIHICTECVDIAASNKKNIVIDNVLTYINSYRHGSSKMKMRDVCAGYYTEEEIFNAKVLLHSENPILFGELIRRQDSNVRTKEEANLDDIYDWFRKLDDNELSVDVCANNIKRLPKYNPEEVEKTSMIERIIQLEESIQCEKETNLRIIARTCQLEAKVFQGSASLENKLNLVQTELGKTDTQIIKMNNEVKNMDKEIKDQKNYAGALKLGVATNTRSSVYSNNRNDNMNVNNYSNNQNIQNNNEWQIAGRKRRAVVGTARPIAAKTGSAGNKVLGAPPPSRHFVIERVLNDVTEDDLKCYITSKNSQLEIRSLICLSHPDSLYKKFKLEISVTDCKIVYAPDFWQSGMRVRPYWKKRTREIDQSADNEDDNESIRSDDE